jgi:hypothetical protein
MRVCNGGMRVCDAASESVRRGERVCATRRARVCDGSEGVHGGRVGSAQKTMAASMHNARSAREGTVCAMEATMCAAVLERKGSKSGRSGRDHRNG